MSAQNAERGALQSCKQPCEGYQHAPEVLYVLRAAGPEAQGAAARHAAALLGADQSKWVVPGVACS